MNTRCLSRRFLKSSSPDGNPLVARAGTKLPIIFHSSQRSATDHRGRRSLRNTTRETAAWLRGPQVFPWTTGLSPSKVGHVGRSLARTNRRETILNLKSRGHTGVFVQPVGFLCDHVEVLTIIDIGFQEFAKKEGMRLWRAESLNESPELVQGLANLVRARTKEAG